MNQALHLRSQDLSGLAAIESYVEWVRRGYREIGEGAPATVRERIYGSEPKGMLTSYMAILPDMGAMGGYMYSAGFSAETAWFLTPLFDAGTGEPLALLDGASINPFKTGAAGAVAVDELAREDAKDIAVIGSGVQARGQLQCACAVRSPDTVLVYSPTPEHRKQFAEEMTRETGCSVQPCSSAAEAIKGADIIITATTASTPVFDGSLLEGGEHITAMGQYHPEKREFDTETIRRSVYVPDLRARALQDAGGFLLAREEGAVSEEDITAELGEVVAGKEPGRKDGDQITLFDSGGTGIETAAAAMMLFEEAKKENMGTEISFAPARDAMTGINH